MREKITNEDPNSKLNIPNSKFQIPTSDYNGITLIALVVTIIVLLILAGVTINIVLSEGGILRRANEAELEQELAEYKDKIEIAKGAVATKETNQGKIPLEDLRNELIDTFDMEVSEIENGVFTVSVPKIVGKITITQNGKSVLLQYPVVNGNNNNSGNIGDGSDENDEDKIVIDPNEVKLRATISAGENHSFVLDENGHLWGWGSNGGGKIR